MNERNVAALRAILDTWYGPAVTRYGGHPIIGEVLTKLIGPEARQDLAEVLAERGALVPAALTDEECGEIHSEPAFFDVSFDATKQREVMERIAKGEA